MSKIVLFEYFLRKVVEWYCEHYKLDITSFNSQSNNNLSKLKVIKLHFFACSTNREALDIFDDFHAMPYGHVESGIYSQLDSLRSCTVTNSKMIIDDLDSFVSLSHIHSDVIDTSVQILKEKNPLLISLDPFELVELSHKWYSWRYNFQKARQSGNYSRPINSDLILKEEKFYSIF